jgi:nitrogen fixation NifU-like protein
VCDLQGIGIDDDGGRQGQDRWTRAQTLTREFLDMATGKLDVDAPNHIGRLAVFAGVRNLPTRVKCAILPWHTLQAAFNAQPSVSTEAGDDRS